MNTRRNVVAVVTFCSLFLASWLLPDAVASEGPRQPVQPLAEMVLGASRIDWQSAGDSGRLVLTVAGPEGLWIRKEFAAGQPASLSLFDEDGQQLTNGTYTYELRALSGRVQSGHFSIRDGSFVTAPSKPPIRKVTANLTDDELIIEGNACIGEACTNGDDDFPLLKLKGEHPNIFFDDIESPPSLLSSSFNDWGISINASDVAKFSIVDVDGGMTPFSIAGGAPDNSLYIRDNGYVGLGTATPGTNLHLFGSATADVFASAGPDPVSGPAFNFGYAGSSYGRGVGFLNVRPDASAAAPNPSLRFLTADTERMIITNTGSVGIGTASPAAKLHLFDSANVFTELRVENTSSGVNGLGSVRAHSDTAVVHFRAHGSGRTISRFGVVLGGWSEIVQDIGNGLAIGTQNSTPIILGTNNTNRLQINGSTGTVTIAGNLTVNGTFSNPSSRELKEGFQPVDPKTILDKFAQLSIQEWSYKSDTQKLRHVGPTVEDFQASFGLGTEGQHIFPMDVQGVTMTAVQGLYQVVQEKDAEIAELRQRLATLEKLVSKLSAQ